MTSLSLQTELRLAAFNATHGTIREVDRARLSAACRAMRQAIDWHAPSTPTDAAERALLAACELATLAPEAQAAHVRAAIDALMSATCSNRPSESGKSFPSLGGRGKRSPDLRWRDRADLQ